MFTQVTPAGKALLDAATGPIVLTRYELGSAYGYTLEGDATGLRGQVVYSNVPSPLAADGPQLLKTSVYLGYEVGPFAFGEIALYAGDTLFALCVNPVLIEKRAPGPTTDGAGLRLDIYMHTESGNYEMFLTMAETSNEFRLSVFPSIDLLPQALHASPNAYIVMGEATEQSSFLAYSDREGVWAFDAYEIFAGEVSVDSATTKSVRIPVDRWNEKLNPSELGHTMMQFASGKLMGIARYVVSATLSNDQNFVVLGLSGITNYAAQKGDKVHLYLRSDLPASQTAIPIASHDEVGGIRVKTAAGDFRVDSHGFLQLASPQVKSVNNTAPDQYGNVTVPVLQGPQGEKGDKGDTGAQGIQGIQGPQGLQGAKGDQGDVGPQGLPGAKGDRGEQGLQGLQGIQGEKGDKGDVGTGGTVAADLAAEIVRATGVEAGLRTDVDAATAAIAAEQARAEGVEATLRTDVDAANAAVVDEETRAKAAEDALALKIEDAGNLMSAFMGAFNSQRKTFLAPAVALTHTFTHNLDTTDVAISVMVKGDDGIFRNDIIAYEETDSNTVTFFLTEARIIKATAQMFGNISWIPN